jgi:hypothetical protein
MAINSRLKVDGLDQVGDTKGLNLDQTTDKMAIHSGSRVG